MGSWARDSAERTANGAVDPTNLNQVILAEGKERRLNQIENRFCQPVYLQK